MVSASVEIRELRKTFWDESRGEVRAVDGIDFDCQSGEVFGLLGANGAGKTTTLRMLATILKPTGGSASLNGYDVIAAPEDVRRSHPANQVNRRVEALIDRFSIGEYAGARVGKLSSGMKQKISIARTIVHDPPILIFDEPTVGLDVMAALEMQSVIRELRDEGKAIIFSTHIMSEAEKLCDRIGIIHQGQILALGTLEEHRQATGKHYLEDVFVHEVMQAEDQSAKATASSSVSAGDPGTSL